MTHVERKHYCCPYCDTLEGYMHGSYCRSAGIVVSRPAASGDHPHDAFLRYGSAQLAIEALGTPAKRDAFESEYDRLRTENKALAASHQRLKEALERIAAIEDRMVGGDWEEIEEARGIAREVLKDAP